MTRAQRQSLRNLLINNDIDLHAPLSRREKQPIQSILLILRRRASQIQLGRKPPIENPDFTLSVLERNTDGVHVAASVNVPLDIIALSLRSERLEAMEMVAVVVGTVLDEVHVGMFWLLAAGGCASGGGLEFGLDILHGVLHLVEEERHDFSDDSVSQGGGRAAFVRA